MDPYKNKGMTGQASGSHQPRPIDVKHPHPNPKGPSIEAQTDRFVNEGGAKPQPESSSKDGVLEKGPKMDRASIPGATPEKTAKSIPPGPSPTAKQGAKGGSATNARHGESPEKPEKNQASCDDEGGDTLSDKPTSKKP